MSGASPSAGELSGVKSYGERRQFVEPPVQRICPRSDNNTGFPESYLSEDNRRPLSSAQNPQIQSCTRRRRCTSSNTRLSLALRDECGAVVPTCATSLAKGSASLALCSIDSRCAISTVAQMGHVPTPSWGRCRWRFLTELGIRGRCPGCVWMTHC